MAMFGFLKKKKVEELPMPPPPSPPDLPPLLRGDIEDIRAAPEAFPEMPEMPSMTAMPMGRPELPAPAGEKEVRVFDRTIPEEMEVPEEPVFERRVPVKPTFVAVEDYKRIINDTNVVRSKLMDAENFVRRLGDLKNEEERSFEKWRSLLEDVEKKLNYVDHLIAKAG